MENPTNRYTTVRRHLIKLPDVISCDIELTPASEIGAVHVTARPGRPAKQIVRDIQAVFAAEESVYLDHRKISVAQYGGDVAPAQPPTLDRLSVGGVSLHQVSGALEVEVTLSAGQIQTIGRASGSNTRFDTRRIVAHATLDAVTKLVNGDPALSLGELKETDLGGRRVLVVCVNRNLGRSEANLMGCAEIGYDPTQAVICAVLDAVNRVVGSLPPREPVEYEVGPAPLDE